MSESCSGTEGNDGFRLNLSVPSFVFLNRDGKVALAEEETDEKEDERERREVSEIMDSGDDAVETELASEERRTEQ